VRNRCMRFLLNGFDAILRSNSWQRSSLQFLFHIHVFSGAVTDFECIFDYGI